MYSDKKSANQSNTPRQFLDTVYNELQYREGALFDAVSLPSEKEKSEWIDKGDWLSLAAEIGAEKVFFVNNEAPNTHQVFQFCVSFF